MPPPEADARFNAMIGTPTLDLSHNQRLEPERLADVLSHMPDVVRLDLSDTDLADLSPLEGLEHLRVLFLRNTEVEDLTPIANITTLETLVISDTLVHDLEPLRNLSNLTWLAMERNTTDSLAPLDQIKSLRVLELAGALIHSHSLEPLQSITNLERVDARSIHIPLSEIRLLRGTLPNCAVITHVVPEPTGDMTEEEFNEAHQSATMADQPISNRAMQIAGIMSAAIDPDDFTNQDDYEEACREAQIAGEINAAIDVDADDNTSYRDATGMPGPPNRDDMSEEDLLNTLQELTSRLDAKRGSKSQQMPKEGEPRRKLKR